MSDPETTICDHCGAEAGLDEVTDCQCGLVCCGVCINDHDCEGSGCAHPCPYPGCETCASYWKRMVEERNYDPVEGRWTWSGLKST